MNKITSVEAIVPVDMQEYASENQCWECYQTSDPKGGPESVWILWIPMANRAAVCWGGDSHWTDADSPRDAYERCFGIDNKGLVN